MNLSCVRIPNQRWTLGSEWVVGALVHRHIVFFSLLSSSHHNPYVDKKKLMIRKVKWLSYPTLLRHKQKVRVILLPFLSNSMVCDLLSWSFLSGMFDFCAETLDFFLFPSTSPKHVNQPADALSVRSVVCYSESSTLWDLKKINICCKMNLYGCDIGHPKGRS